MMTDIKTIAFDVDNRFFAEGLWVMLKDIFNAYENVDLTHMSNVPLHEALKNADIYVTNFKAGEELVCCHAMAHRKKKSLLIVISEGKKDPRTHGLPRCMESSIFVRQNESVENVRKKIIEAWEMTQHDLIEGRVEIDLCKSCKPVHLTTEELCIANYICHGFSPVQISKFRNISPKNVSSHKRMVMRKFNLNNDNEFIHMMNRLEINILNKVSMISGIRMQPIFDLQTNKVFGYEVLSRFKDSVQAENFFKCSRPEITFSIFQLQMGAVVDADASYYYFLNLPVRVLMLSKLCREIKPLLEHKVVIEIQDPHSLMMLSEKERSSLDANLKELQLRGFEVWVDDITVNLLPAVMELQGCVNGIKIDKHTFWQLANKPNMLKRLVDVCLILAPQVLIEGVETRNQRYLATQAGARYLQGYLWQELQTMNPVC
jgi:EAL domain-containing protein (putative c-di-GMP-specific phosphodiesterase class I)/DNA-binding CsgD family transcriptional regulator